MPSCADENGRIDRSGGVVERDDEVEIAIERRYPAMGRAVLEQQHARQRPALALLAMRTAALGLRRQTRRLQREPGHGVAELVAVPLLQLLVKMLHGEVAIEFLIKLVASAPVPPPAPAAARACQAADPAIPPAHPRHTGPSAGGNAGPTCPSSSPASSAVSRRLRWRSNASSNRSTKTSHNALVRRIAPSRTGGELGGQLTRYERGQLTRHQHAAAARLTEA